MTNAIIHADLMVDGVLKVEKYDNKFVFTNPGLLKLPVEQIYAGEETKARNQRIQNMFRMIGFGENLGSGFPLILSAWNEKHWLRPELVEQPELLQVMLILMVENRENNVIVPKDGTINGMKELSERQMLILKFIKEDGTITIPELALKTEISRRTILRELTMLQEKGIIVREGARKNGRWVIVPQNEPLEKQQ